MFQPITCRALQLYRSLNLCITDRIVSKLTQKLSEIVSDPHEERQAAVLEIIDTFGAGIEFYQKAWFHLKLIKTNCPKNSFIRYFLVVYTSIHISEITKGPNPKIQRNKVFWFNRERVESVYGKTRTSGIWSSKVIYQGHLSYMNLLLIICRATTKKTDYYRYVLTSNQ